MYDETVHRVLDRLPAETIERLGAAPMDTVRPERQPRTDEETPLPSISTMAGDLEVRGVIGEGGMGRIVLARQRSLCREVAIKTLLPHRRSPEAEAALRTEGRCAGGLEHPNIVPVHALVRDEQGAPLLVMKRVEGTSWRDRLRKDGLERDIEILIQVCNAVHFAHTRGVLHRDIKPDNVMLGEFGEVTLVDWGVALRLSEREGATELAGTPAYLAPEMLAGGLDLSPRTDVYLLGATLHEILTGRAPHRGATLREVLSSAAAPGPAALDGAPEGLVRICRKALDPVPQRRFLSAAELRDALAGHLRHRASGRLAEEALERLTEAKRAEDPALRRRLLVECHFGLRQALREWADSEDAQRGLTACLAEQARLEIAEGNRGAAELLVADLDGLRGPDATPADVIDGLAALRARQEEEAAARTRLQALDRDQDLGVSRRARLALAFILIGSNLSSILYWLLSERPLLTPEMLARETCLLALLGCAGVLLARRALFRNRANRQVILSILVTGSTLALHDVLALWRPQPVEETLAEAMGLLGLALALITLFSSVRWFWGISALTLAASVVATARPETTFPLWAVVTSLPFIGWIIAWWRPPAKRPGAVSPGTVPGDTPPRHQGTHGP